MVSRYRSVAGTGAQKTRRKQVKIVCRRAQLRVRDGGVAPRCRSRRPRTPSGVFARRGRDPSRSTSHAAGSIASDSSTSCGGREHHVLVPGHRFVAHHEERAAGSDGLGRGPQRRVAGIVDRRVEEMRRDQVEGADRDRLREVVAGPRDAVGDPGGGGVLGGAIERRLRDVGGGDLPAALGQPDGVGALAAPEVERGARGRGRRSPRPGPRWVGRSTPATRSP